MIRINPEIYYNPQRGDRTTQKFGIKDYQQCMSNCYQNNMIWLARKWPELFSEFENMGTVSGGVAYTSMLEARLKIPGQVYESEHHTRMLNLILEEAKAPVRAVAIDANLVKIANHIVKHRRPVILGIKGIVGANFRHIISVIGASSDGFESSDPYGDIKTGYKNHDGWKVFYSTKLLAANVTRMILLEDHKWP